MKSIIAISVVAALAAFQAQESPIIVTPADVKWADAPPSLPPGAKAAAITYADYDIASVPAVEWPNWTADRPQPGISIRAGEPLCTVYACDPAASVAKALTDERRQMVLAWMRAR